MIKLGSKVVDRISGFTGIATGRAVYLNKCVRICVTGRVREGKIVEDWIDELYLEEIDVEVIEVDVAQEDGGGPVRSDPPRR